MSVPARLVLRFTTDLILRQIGHPPAAPDWLGLGYEATLPDGWVAEGTAMADYVTDVDLRKLQVRYQRTPTGGVVEDVAVTTHHFLKLDGTNPTGAWITSDYTTLEGLFDTFWGSIKTYSPTSIALGQYRWYKSGAEWDVTPAPYNPAERITEKNVAGSGQTTSALPPQCAVSVTEKTALRPNWGRFYLPLTAAAAATTEGRVNATAQPAIAAAAVTLYNAARAANLVPVVFGRALPSRQRKDGVTLEPRPATAFEVLAIQVDDVFDTVRSRRWDTVLSRVTTALT